MASWVSSADRETSVENMLKRFFLYQADKHADENPSVEQIIEYSFKKLTKKFGKELIIHQRCKTYLIISKNSSKEK